MITEAYAVIEAANQWAAAQEALVAAQHGFQATGDEEEAADLAGAKFVLAITRWRSRGDPD